MTDEEERRHDRALRKARHRAEVFNTWPKTLTKETFAEFQKLMKEADKLFDKANP